MTAASRGLIIPSFRSRRTPFVRLRSMTTNVGRLSYEVAKGWGKLPKGWEASEVPGVAVDAQDRVYIINRGEHPLIVLDREGNCIAFWGEGILQDPHGVHVGPDNCVYVADRDVQVVVKLSHDGRIQLTLGTRGRPSQEQSGSPFNRPTGVALSPGGDIYVSDGYGNSKVHKYSSDGSLLSSWGGHGSHPGQFNIPHGICVDGEGRVYVADRENNRVQLFDEEGDYLKEWGDLMRPSDVSVDAEANIYVSELEHRVSVLSFQGEVLARWGGEEGRAPGQLSGPHGICVDSRGDIYVGEVGGKRIQKFVCQR